MLIFMSTLAVYNYLHFVQLQRDSIQIAADEKAGKKLTPKQEESKKDLGELVKAVKPSADDLKEDVDAHLGSYFKLVAFRYGQTHHFEANTPLRRFRHLDDDARRHGAHEARSPHRKLFREKFYVVMALVGFAVGITAETFHSPIGGPYVTTSALDTWYLTGTTYELGRLHRVRLCSACSCCSSNSARSAPSRLPSATSAAWLFRMALSTSLICTTIFEGYGFGLFGKLQRYQLYYVVAAVWLVILVISPIWLRHFRFGPLEWLWRSLTYWKRQPFRIREAAPAATPTPAPAATA